MMPSSIFGVKKSNILLNLHVRMKRVFNRLIIMFSTPLENGKFKHLPSLFQMFIVTEINAYDIWNIYL